MVILGLLFILTSSSRLCGGSKVERQCGTSRLPQSYDERIIGGTLAKEAQFPWQVSVQAENVGNHFCGGSLIGPDLVVTAAHCMQNISVVNLYVQAGFLDLKDPSFYSQWRRVSRMIVHESYDNENYNNDIALLRLDAPFDLAASEGHVGTVCLPSEDYTLKGYVTVAGWGDINNDGPSSPKLLAVVVPVVRNSVCRMNDDYYNSTTKFCAGSPGRDSCPGDSGGPAVHMKDGVATLVGIVSYGFGCGVIPGYYTRVSAYEQWIAMKIAELRSHWVDARWRSHSRY